MPRCLFVLLVVSIAFSTPLIGFYSNLQYRRRLTFVDNTSPVHTDESFALDTYALSTSNPIKLQPDCSDLVILRNSSSGTVFDLLPFWFETACPSSDPAHPYTTIWVDIASEHSEASGDSLWVVYGSSDVSEIASLDTKELTWAGGAEVRLYGDSATVCSSIGAGWDEIGTQWNRYFAVAALTETEGDGSVFRTSNHSHTMTSTDVTCNSVFNMGAQPKLGFEACDDIPGENLVGVMDTHSHVGEHSTDIAFSSVHRLDVPPYFAVRACSSSGSTLSHRTEIDVAVSGGKWVVPLVTKPGGGNPWTDWYGNSQNRHLSFGATPGFGTGGGQHQHDFPDYISGTFSLTASTEVVSVLDQGPDAVFNASSHAHGLDVQMKMSATGSPSTDYVWFYYRDGPFVVSFGDEDWESETMSVIWLFLDKIPPLGFSMMTANGQRLVQGRDFGETPDSFVNSFDGTGHTHDLIDTNPMTTQQDVDADPGSTVRLETTGSCPGTDFAVPLDSSDHQHLCTGTTSGPASGEPGFLPNHVKLIFARRWDSDVAERPITVSTTEDFCDTLSCSDANTGGGGGPNNDWMTYVYIGAGVGGGSLFVVFVLVVVAVLLIVVFCVVKKKRRNSSSASDIPLDEQPTTTSSSTHMSARATLRVQEELCLIDPKEIELLKELGHGGGGAVVMKARWSGKEVAYKVFPTKLSVFDTGDTEFEEFEKEVSFASSLKHPNVITFFGCCLDERLGIVMEFCELGEIGWYCRVKTKDGESVPMERKIQMLLGITHGMAYLHGKNVVHRDLKPANVLLDSEEVPKIMDFGISRLISTSGRMTQRVGTQVYMAPEITLGTKYTAAIDVFSMAIMTFEILTENWHPYGVAAERGTIEFKVANDPECRPDVASTELPDLLKALLKKMWNHEPSVRPSFVEIREELDGYVAQEMQDKSGEK